MLTNVRVDSGCLVSYGWHLAAIAGLRLTNAEVLAIEEVANPVSLVNLVEVRIPHKINKRNNVDKREAIFSAVED
jgi:hypothetical protein